MRWSVDESSLVKSQDSDDKPRSHFWPCIAFVFFFTINSSTSIRLVISVPSSTLILVTKQRRIFAVSKKAEFNFPFDRTLFIFLYFSFYMRLLFENSKYF